MLVRAKVRALEGAARSGGSVSAEALAGIVGLEAEASKQRGALLDTLAAEAGARAEKQQAEAARVAAEAKRKRDAAQAVANALGLGEGGGLGGGGGGEKRQDSATEEEEEEEEEDSDAEASGSGRLAGLAAASVSLVLRGKVVAAAPPPPHAPQREPTQEHQRGGSAESSPSRWGGGGGGYGSSGGGESEQQAMHISPGAVRYFTHGQRGGQHGVQHGVQHGGQHSQHCQHGGYQETMVHVVPVTGSGGHTYFLPVTSFGAARPHAPHAQGYHQMPPYPPGPYASPRRGPFSSWCAQQPQSQQSQSQQPQPQSKPQPQQSPPSPIPPDGGNGGGGGGGSGGDGRGSSADASQGASQGASRGEADAGARPAESSGDGLGKGLVARFPSPSPAHPSHKSHAAKRKRFSHGSAGPSPRDKDKEKGRDKAPAAVGASLPKLSRAQLGAMSDEQRQAALISQLTVYLKACGAEGAFDGRGWRVQLVTRQEGAARGADTFFFSPCGKKFRSRADVARWLGLSGAPVTKRSLAQQQAALRHEALQRQRNASMDNVGDGVTGTGGGGDGGAGAGLSSGLLARRATAELKALQAQRLRLEKALAREKEKREAAR